MYKKIILFIGLFILVGKLCHMATSGFSMFKIQTPALIKNQSWASYPPPPPEVLDQTFTFLGVGRSAYAFVSEDGKFVLKFFKYHNISPLYERFPVPSFHNPLKKWFYKATDWKELFKSFEIAYDEIREETRFLYLHLGETKDLLPTITIVDRIGIKHKIALDRMQFLLQQKAEMVYPYLTRLVQEGNLVAAKEGIDAIVDLISENLRKGILDHDVNVRTNFGFIDSHVVKIDVGSFQKEYTEDDWKRVQRSQARHFRNFSSWLEELSDELADHFEKRIRDEQPCDRRWNISTN